MVHVHYVPSPRFLFPPASSVLFANTFSAYNNSNSFSERGETRCKCNAGYFGAAGSSDGCQACDAGKYSPVTDATDSGTCRDCEAGQYTPTTGATACEDCRAGTVIIS